MVQSNAERKTKFAKTINLNFKSINIPQFLFQAKQIGVYTKPGDLEYMQDKFFENNYGTFIIKQAGHWVQQEQPEKTSDAIFKIL